jgi:NADH:ubiquinone oxidoreductase subunit F (NADH-binding)
MLDDLPSGAEADAWLVRARDLAVTMQYASLCGLGQAAPLALLRALEGFPGEFRRGTTDASRQPGVGRG